MDEADRRPVRFLELLRALVNGRVDFVVVGGVAAVLEGAPVSTFDLDVVYSPEGANVARLVEVLATLDAVYVDPAGRRLSPTEERLRRGGQHLLRTRFGRLDVLGSIGDGLGFADLVPDSRRRSIQGLAVSVLRLEAVIASKEATGRAKDLAVLPMLRNTLAELGGRDGD
jgi:hypothetical protein